MTSSNYDQDRRIETAGSARLLLANQELIFPAIKLKEEQALAALIEEFDRSGTVSLANVAKLSSLRAMRTDFETKARRGERAMAKLHEETT